MITEPTLEEVVIKPTIWLVGFNSGEREQLSSYHICLGYIQPCVLAKPCFPDFHVRTLWSASDMRTSSEIQRKRRHIERS